MATWKVRRVFEVRSNGISVADYRRRTDFACGRTCPALVAHGASVASDGETWLPPSGDGERGFRLQAEEWIVRLKPEATYGSREEPP